MYNWLDNIKKNPNFSPLSIQIRENARIFTEDEEDAIAHYIHNLCFLVACEALPLSRVVGPIIYNIIMQSIKLGQKNPSTPPNQLFPHPTILRIRTQIINIAQQFRQKVVSQYKNFTHHGMMIDGGTINSFHFLDFCLTVPIHPQQTNAIISPYNYKTILIDNETVESIQFHVIDAIKCLRNLNINVTSITSDNYPTQIIALAPWSKKSLLSSNEFDEKFSKRIIHCPCAAHTINLIAKSISTNEAPFFIQNIYNNFNQVSNVLDKFSEAGLEKPPKIVKTRWLLMMNQLIYLRKHDIFFTGYSNYNYPLQTQSFLLNDPSYNDIIGIDFKENKKYPELHKHFLRICQKCHININLFSVENFKNFMFIGRILWPLWQAILFFFFFFFEKDISSMVTIFQIFNQINNFWDNMKKYFKSQENIMSIYDINGWIETIEYFQSQFIFREFHTYEWPTICLSYLFSPAGRNTFRKKLIESGVSLIENPNQSIIDDYSLFLEDYFGADQTNFVNNEMSFNLNTDDITYITETDINTTDTNLYLHDGDIQVERNVSEQNLDNLPKLKKSDAWFFPEMMMKKIEKFII